MLDSNTLRQEAGASSACKCRWANSAGPSLEVVEIGRKYRDKEDLLSMLMRNPHYASRDA